MVQLGAVRSVEGKVGREVGVDRFVFAGQFLLAMSREAARTGYSLPPKRTTPDMRGVAVIDYGSS